MFVKYQELGNKLSILEDGSKGTKKLKINYILYLSVYHKYGLAINMYTFVIS